MMVVAKLDKRIQDPFTNIKESDSSTINIHQLNVELKLRIKLSSFPYLPAKFSSKLTTRKSSQRSKNKTNTFHLYSKHNKLTQNISSVRVHVPMSYFQYITEYYIKDTYELHISLSLIRCIRMALGVLARHLRRQLEF